MGAIFGDLPDDVVSAEVAPWDAEQDGFVSTGEAVPASTGQGGVQDTEHGYVKEVIVEQSLLVPLTQEGCLADTRPSPPRKPTLGARRRHLASANHLFYQFDD